MRAPLLFAALLMLLASLSVAGPVHAEDAYSTLLDAAFDEFEAGRYQAALDLFEDAAEVRRTGEVLFNIGACHEYLGNLEPAVEALKESIKLGISASLQDRAQRKIQALEQRLKPADPDPDPDPGTTSQPTGTVVAAVDPEWAEKRRTLRGVGGGLLAGGGAAVAAGGVLWALAWNENVQFGQATDVETKQAHIDAVADFALAGDITAGIGAAAAVSGLVISLVGCRCQAPGAAANDVAFAPAVLPLPDGGFAFVVGGEF